MGVNLSHFGVSIVVVDFAGVGDMMVGREVLVSGVGSVQCPAGRLGLGASPSGGIGGNNVRLRRVSDGEQTLVWDYFGERRSFGELYPGLKKKFGISRNGYSSL